jgi:hypothetical protein
MEDPGPWAALLDRSSRRVDLVGFRGVVFAQERGSLNVVEKTTFEMPARAPVPGSPSAANPALQSLAARPSHPGRLVGCEPLSRLLAAVSSRPLVAQRDPPLLVYLVVVDPCIHCNRCAARMEWGTPGHIGIP